MDHGFDQLDQKKIEFWICWSQFNFISRESMFHGGPSVNVYMRVCVLVCGCMDPDGHGHQDDRHF